MPRFERRSPYDGALVWQGEAADAVAVGRAVATARAAQPDWEDAGLPERARVLEAYAALVRAEAETLAATIARETGKPLWEARTEAASVAAKVAISAQAHAERTGDHASEAGGAVAPGSAGAAGGVASRLTHRPHGVLAVLGPFNFPAHLPNGHIVPALLAGNAVVFKPSEHAPGAAELMAALWARAGLPAGVLTLTQGLADTGRALAAHPGIDGLLFTGSSRTGAALARQFAGTPHRMLALEMGGNNPLVVWRGAEPEAAARVAAQSAFLSAGQRCTAARRLIVPAGAAGDAFVDALVATARRIRVGAPFDDPQPFMGTVIHEDAAQAIHQAAAALPGSTLLAATRDGAFLTPHIQDVTGHATPDEEIFGPVLQVRRARDFAEACALAADTRYGLAAALVGGDDADWARFRRQVRAGVLNRNRPTNGAASSAPFGGWGLSGNNRPSAYYAADYCAWPVASMESATPTAAPVEGLD